ncbi:GntR family transcriptional regulator [Acuticoccus sp. I52.16.1]|uniref:GntR family transcriptional regulator n=1 Tax=Acuticoccus sp. I52.16.1 TaxID=2928472 RepID=UPI001FD436FF|nr:GntR family transcriptional regulator [Acuticoccus sp. I52.16.1]UOM37277.1 GntR family transcriptional regulator [Acuticoccus sp. I52.16.1]
MKTVARDHPIDLSRGAAPPAAGLDSLAPVARPTVQDIVHGELRRLLIQGAIDPGQTLKIRDLAERLSVSTMPVREAFARLVSEGALEALPNRTVRVPPLTRARLDDLERARALIEGELLACALPALAADDAALTELERLTRAYDDLAPPAVDASAETADLNHAFHFAIYRAAGSVVLLPIVESLWLQSGPVIRRAAALFPRAERAGATEHHRAIIRAVRAGDAAAARAALSADIGRAFALVRASLAEDER